MMDLQAFLRSRSSIRRFDSEPIPTSVVERILETAMCAPSAHNRQPWRFAVVSTTTGKSRLADSMAVEYRQDLAKDGIMPVQIETLVEKSRIRINAAPLVVILCMDVAEMDVYRDNRRATAERTMALQSTANAGATLLLAAHAEGLGGVWSCAPLFAPHAVNVALGLPEQWEPQAMLLIGKPAEAPKPRGRKALKEIALFS
jgi:F420 biosynthesis protein FbiB-like protein